MYIEDNKMENNASSIVDLFLLGSLWAANWAMHVNGSIIITLIAAVGSTLYAINQAITLYERLTKKKK